MAATASARLSQLRSIIGALELAQQKPNASHAGLQHHAHLLELVAGGGVLNDAPANGGAPWVAVTDTVKQLLDMLERLASRAEVRVCSTILLCSPHHHFARYGLRISDTWQLAVAARRAAQGAVMHRHGIQGPVVLAGTHASAHLDPHSASP